MTAEVSTTMRNSYASSAPRTTLLGGRVKYLLGALMILMAIKFVTVASQFMHLKFDDKLLSRLFYTGLILAVGVYMIALTTFRIWGNG